MNAPLLILGAVLYLIAACRTYRWIRTNWDTEIFGVPLKTILLEPKGWKLFVSCIGIWWLVEIVLVLGWHESKIKDGFEAKYEVCDKCDGRPIWTGYRPVWESGKPPLKCPKCGGAGIVEKEK